MLAPSAPCCKRSESRDDEISTRLVYLYLTLLRISLSAHDCLVVVLT